MVKELRNKNILLISPEAWGNNFVSKHHFAIELSKRDNNVFFLTHYSNKIQIIQITDNLQIVHYRNKFRGLGKLPNFISSFLTLIEFMSIERICKTKFDIIWNFDSSRFFNLSRIKKVFKIAHLVDLTESFQRPLLCKTSDVGFCTTQYIAEEMKKNNDHIFNIGHGVALSTSQMDENDTTLIKEIKNTYEICAGYVGNLAISYLDWETIYQIATYHPEVAFIFIGSLKKSNISKGENSNPFIKKVLGLNNAYFIGERPSNSIIPILIELDVLLLIYKSKLFKEQLSNPHKLLEYLATGKVVLASWTDEYKNKRQLLEMCSKNEDLPGKFKEIIENPSYYNSLEKQSLRKKYVSDHSYANIVDKIESTLKEL